MSFSNRLAVYAAVTGLVFVKVDFTHFEDGNLKPFVALGKRLKRHRASILAYFGYKISNGLAEGINNKVKVIKRMAFGYRDFNYFRLKVLAATGKLSPLPKRPTLVAA